MHTFITDLHISFNQCPKFKTDLLAMSAYHGSPSGCEYGCDGLEEVSGLEIPLATRGSESPLAASYIDSPLEVSSRRVPLAASDRGYPLVANGRESSIQTSEREGPLVANGRESPLAASGDRNLYRESRLDGCDHLGEASVRDSLLAASDCDSPSGAGSEAGLSVAKCEFRLSGAEDWDDCSQVESDGGSWCFVIEAECSCETACEAAYFCVWHVADCSENLCSL